MIDQFISDNPSLIRMLIGVLVTSTVAGGVATWRTSTGALNRLADAFSKFADAVEKRLDSVENRLSATEAKCDERHKG